MAAGETVRDLVIRMRIEQVGTAEIKLPEWKKASDEQKTYFDLTRSGIETIDKLRSVYVELTSAVDAYATARNRASQAELSGGKIPTNRMPGMVGVAPGMSPSSVSIPVPSFSPSFPSSGGGGVGLGGGGNGGPGPTVTRIPIPDWKKAVEGQKEYNKTTRDGLEDIFKAIRAEKERVLALKEKIEAIKRDRQETEALRPAVDKANESQKRLTLAYKRQYDLGIVETVNRLARGYAFLAASQGESAEQMARQVLQFQAYFDLARGGLETIARLRNTYIALAAAVEAYAIARGVATAAEAAGAASGVASAAGSSFIGGLAVRASPLLSNPIVGRIAAMVAVIGGGFAINSGAKALANDEDSIFEGLINAGLTKRREHRERQQNSLLRFGGFNKDAAAYSDTLFGFDVQRAGGGEAGLLGLQGVLMSRLASNRTGLAGVGGAGAESTQLRAELSSRILSDTEKLKDINEQLSRLQIETAREGVATEKKKLSALERQQQLAERIKDSLEKDINRGATSFASLRKSEQDRVGIAFDNLAKGREVKGRDRELLEKVGTNRIKGFLEQQDIRNAFQGGYGRLVGSEQSELANAASQIATREKAINQAEKNIRQIEESSKQAGDAMAKQIQKVIDDMRDAFIASFEAQKQVERSSQNAQRGAAGR